MSPRILAFLIAAAFTTMIYAAVRVTGKHLVDGVDKRPSTSKAQWWIWTALVIAVPSAPDSATTPASTPVPGVL